jgi:hypothetical protein
VEKGINNLQDIQNLDIFINVNKTKEVNQMKYKWIKKVITKTGKVMYYQGDGLWFGRISNVEAELLLATEQCQLWEAPKLKLVK